ncbi:MAG: asparaginase family protein [Rhodospirillales bacterium]|nr:asparaginase family protein [Rhodospirillales bacterium]
MSGTEKPKVAIIGTGGTLASIAASPLEMLEYDPDRGLDIDGLLSRFPEAYEIADIVPVRFRTLSGYKIYFDEWKELAARCDALVSDDPGLAGIVITHGTSSLEETAYFLNLVLKVDVPVVLVGAQRPASALSSDGGLNLVNAVRVATSVEARGMGVLVLLNDEINAARDVAKLSTMRVQAFQSPDFGLLGHADGDHVSFYRRPVRRSAPDTEFDIRGLTALPRVDIQYAYAGSDGAAVRAFVAAGARGIVSAGFAPGFPGPADAEALAEAMRQGVVVVQSTRAGSGRAYPERWSREGLFLSADNLTPQKARLLLALALTITRNPGEIARIFATY